MAKGQFQTSIGSYGVDVVWESAADAAKNTSTVTVEVFVRYYSISIGSRLCRCTLDGQTRETPTDPIHHSGSAARKSVGSFTFSVRHGADGTAVLPLTAGFYFDLTSNSHGYIGWLEAQATLTLDAIPQAAVLTAAGGAIGGSARFSFTPGHESHSFSFLLDTGKVLVEKTFSAGSTQTQSFTLPLDAGDYLEYLQGTPPTAAFFATLTTYRDGASIGSSRAEFTVTLPPYRQPTLTVAACHRANAQGHTDPAGTCLHLDVRATGSPYPKDSTAENPLRLWLDAGTGRRELPLAEGSFSGLVPDLSLDTAQVYHLSLWVEDASESCPPVYRDIPTAAADFHLREGGNGAAFGCYATREKVLQLAPGWTLYLGDLSLADYIRQTLEEL